ncbi:hypothetical protein [Streptomyces subrutilus]|uniref:hypothetical protein n=1 Tax=Streptomyces subrutilus TaxID=36818 RepID=UPI0014309A48|nr:hypothetical protein [Streptomyces subrutilus]
MPASAAATTRAIPPGLRVPPGAHRSQADTGPPAEAFERREGDTWEGLVIVRAESR